MKSLDLTDLTNAESSLLQALTPEQQDRVSEILDRYFTALESGVPVSHEKILAENPDLAEPLKLYLESCAQVHDMATRFGGQLPAAAAPALAGDEQRIIGDFELIREIGRGGMGIVYEARQISLGRRVALKMLPFAAVLDGKQIARFKNEAQAAAQLHHPNIVPVFAIGVERGVHYYAMQFIDGQPLDRAIEELRDRLGKCSTSAPSRAGNNSETTEFFAGTTLRPSLERKSGLTGDHVRTVVALGMDAANALHAAHEMGVVHRDIKPSNLLLDGEGKVWIADFGLARCQANASLTRTGEVLGSMRYMSPEQAAGRAPQVDHRTDIYSLGATLYELLALRPAFIEDDGPALLRAIDQREPPPLRSLQPRVSIDLESVIAKAMAKQPAERYATAQDFAEDLERVLSGQSTLAKPPTPLERLTKWTRRHARLVTAGTAASLLATAGLSVATLLIMREKNITDGALRHAKENYATAQDTVNELSFLADRLGQVPGAEQIRSDMLSKSLTYYQGFVKQSPENDAELQGEIALTYSRIGDLSRSLGKSREAIAAHRNSLDAWLKLAAAEPSNGEYRENVAMAHNNLAHALQSDGRYAEARKHYEAGIVLAEALLAGQEDAANRERLALFQSNLGLLEMDDHRPAEAEVAVRRAIQLREEMNSAKTPVEEVARLRGLAASYNNLSALVDGDDAKALLMVEKAIVLLEKAATMQKPTSALNEERATTYNNYGSILARIGRQEDAATAYDKSTDIQRGLVRVSPDVATYRENLAITLNNQGMSRWNIGDMAAAEQAFRAALNLLRPLAEQSSADAALQSRLGGIHNNLGMALEQADRDPEALAEYQSAATCLARAYQQNPNVDDHRAFLSKAYGNLSRALRAAGKNEEAVAVTLRRRELWPGQPERLYAVAEELALAWNGLPRESTQGITADECAALVVETLESATAAGLTLPEDLDRREPFAKLDRYPQFLALVKR